MAQGIYKIINVLNNKFYVGSAVDFTKRKDQHWYRLRKGNHANKHLQAAWNKYGEKAFIFALIQEVPVEENLLAAENIWLHEHVDTDNCYNIARDATAPNRGNFGALNPMWGRTFSHTEEAKAKIGAAGLGREQTEETKQQRAATMQGHPVADFTKEEIAASLRDYYSANPHPREGLEHSQATKDKISASRTGKGAGEQHYRYGKTLSDEVKAKIGNTQRGKQKGPRIFTPDGLRRAQENMKRNAQVQLPAAFSAVHAKFPKEVQDKYNFAKAVYTQALVRIEGVVCPKHGVFSQYAAQFRKGRGCPECGKEKRAVSKSKQMKEAWKDEGYREKTIAQQNIGKHIDTKK